MLENLKIEDIQKTAEEYRQLFRLQKEKKIFVFTHESMYTEEGEEKTKQNLMQDSLSEIMREMNISEDNVYALTVECLDFLKEVNEDQLENISFEAEESAPVYTSDMIKILMGNYNDMEYMNEVLAERTFMTYGDLFMSATKRIYSDVWTTISNFIQEATQENKEGPK